MRILLSGGNKTQNIVNAIEKKFRPSGDEFLVVEFLEDINDIYNRGDFFDKAIIAEQSINREGTIVDEAEIRQRINSFVLDTATRNKKVSFVFFTQSEQMANMIHEEILPIRDISVVVLKEPPYYANFFTTIIVNDIGQLPSELVFTPQNIESELPLLDDIGETFEDMDLNGNGSVIPNNTGNLGDEIFGTEDTFGNDTQVEGLIDTDGYDLPLDCPADEVEFPDNDFDNELNNGFDNTGNFENENQDWVGQQTGDWDGQQDTTNWGEQQDTTNWGEQQDTTNWGEQQDTTNWGEQQNNGWGNEFTEDESIDMDTQQPDMLNRSGDLPDYTVPMMPTEQGQEVQAQETVLEGFDTDDEDMYDDKTVDDSYSGVYVPNQGNEYNGEMPIAQEYDPLGQDLYNTPQTSQNNSGYVDSFEQQDMYSDPQRFNNGQNQMNNMNDMGVDMYNQGQQGVDPYNQGMNGQNQEFYETEATQTSNRQQPMSGPVGKRHKGIGALLGGGNRVQNQQMMSGPQIGSKDIRKVKEALKPFASRGNSIVVTGCGGCGTSTIAFNLANIISQIGYTVLLVDMDTEGRSQGYISKACYDSMDVDGSNLMSAVNSSTNNNSNATVVKQGFHLLTMGLATDIQPIEEQLHKEKIARFVSVIKTGYNFVIYDVPFRHSVGFLSDITFMCDNLVLVTDASNWGITKTMLSVCNIDSDDMQDTIFSRAQLVFNRYRNLSRLFGLRVKTCDEIVRAMDKKVIDLAGDDVGLEFSRMSIAGIINDDPMFENGWYEDVQYSDTKKGQDIFIDLIESIVLKKH